jgi:hypothetical protein
MKLGRKLAEGFATDREADPVTRAPEAPTEPDVRRVDAAETAEPARATVRVERHAGV